MIRRLSLALMLGVLALAGCHYGARPEAEASSSQNFKVYKLRGKVVSTDHVKGEVTLNHGAIPGFMDAMTMPYKLKDAAILSELHPGDEITADVLVSQDPNADVLLDHFVVIAQGQPDYGPAMTYHVPAPGDIVPDFKLRNQAGRAIHLAQFKGKALLITFIYTRCPLPNFCPLVTRNFALIEQRLKSDPDLYARTQLLSVSFDPEHDTPERLRAYGAAYIGSDAQTAFEHWNFAVPDQAALEEMAQFFDVGLSSGPGDTITHTLSTTLVGPDGKVAHFYPGNEWTVEQVMDDLKLKFARSTR